MPLAPPTADPPAPASATDHLLTFLADRDAPCPACGYSLRNLRAPICPECGERLELRVGMVEPRMGLWITGLMASVAGAGFNGLLLAYVAIMLSLRGPRGLPGAFVVINTIGLLAQGGLVALWLTRRRQFRNLSTGPRAALVAVAWLLVAADLVLFALFVR